MYSSVFIRFPNSYPLIFVVCNLKGSNNLTRNSIPVSTFAHGQRNRYMPKTIA